MILLRFRVLVISAVTTVAWASSVRLHRQSRHFPVNTTIDVPSCYILNMWSCSHSHALPTWTDCIHWLFFFIVTLLFKVYFMQFTLCIGQFSKTESCFAWSTTSSLCMTGTVSMVTTFRSSDANFLNMDKRNHIEIDGFLTRINFLHFTCTCIAVLLHM